MHMINLIVGSISIDVKFDLCPYKRSKQTSYFLPKSQSNMILTLLVDIRVHALIQSTSPA